MLQRCCRKGVCPKQPLHHRCCCPPLLLLPLAVWHPEASTAKKRPRGGAQRAVFKPEVSSSQPQPRWQRKHPTSARHATDIRFEMFLLLSARCPASTPSRTSTPRVKNRAVAACSALSCSERLFSPRDGRRYYQDVLLLSSRSIPPLTKTRTSLSSLAALLSMDAPSTCDRGTSFSRSVWMTSLHACAPTHPSGANFASSLHDARRWQPPCSPSPLWTASTSDPIS